VEWEWSSIAPYAEQLGFGLVAGFAVGYALKKVGKVLAVLVGLLFVAVQVLASQGFLTVHWGEVQARVDPWFETETLDGAWRSLVGVLTHNLTFAGAFVPGLVVGLRAADRPAGVRARRRESCLSRTRSTSLTVGAGFTTMRGS
jgi:uncharacterized membrane protein (Fun14 family)